MRERIVAEARSWIGTPFHHQGRSKGIAVDCAGLLLGVASALGLPHADYPRREYSRFPMVGERLYDFLRNQAPEISVEQVAPGSIYLFWVHRPTVAQHFAIATEPGRMVHAWSEAERCCETNLGPYWESRIYAAFDFPAAKAA